MPAPYLLCQCSCVPNTVDAAFMYVLSYLQINSYFNMFTSRFDTVLVVVGLVCVLHNVIGYFVVRQCMQVSSLHIKINLRFQGPIGLLFVA